MHNQHIIIKLPGNETTTTSYKELAEAAVKSYNLRCCAMLQLSGLYQINEFIEHIIGYIDAACIFIKNLLESTRNATAAVLPFQLDCVIAVGKPATRPGKKYWNDDDDDDDDDHDEDDDDDGQEQKEQKLDYEDYIGDFEQRIKGNKLQFVKYVPDSSNAPFTWREWAKLFEEFKKKMQETQKNDKKTQYPNKKRFMTFIDRRKEKIKPNIYLYDLPKGPYTRDMSDGYIAV